VLRPGWQWLPSVWLAYWVGQYNPINNRQDELEGDCEWIKPYAALFEWWRTTPKARDVFQAVLAYQPRELTGAVFYQLAAQAGLDVPRDYDLSAKADDLLRQMSTVFGATPIMISTGKQITSGRHRIYAAWRRDVPELLVWVSE
jgi:hypothetical protein